MFFPPIKPPKALQLFSQSFQEKDGANTTPLHNLTIVKIDQADHIARKIMEWYKSFSFNFKDNTGGREFVSMQKVDYSPFLSLEPAVP